MMREKKIKKELNPGLKIQKKNELREGVRKSTRARMGIKKKCSCE